MSDLSARPPRLKIALVQQSVQPVGLQANVDVACNWIDRAAEAGADLVLFPEIHLSPFFPQYAARPDLAEALALDSPAIKQMQAHCRQRGIACIPNIYLSQQGACYDASLVIDAQGSLLGIGKMVHIAQQPKFFEQDYYTPSDSGFRVVDLLGMRVGIVVCFDRHYPESFRACARAGADLVVIPTANVMGEPLDIFEAELRTAAYQNNLFIAMANRTGVEDDMHFAGESMVVDAHGQVQAKAGHAPELLLADIDLAVVRDARRRRPYRDLLRPDAY